MIPECLVEQVNAADEAGEDVGALFCTDDGALLNTESCSDDELAAIAEVTGQLCGNGPPECIAEQLATMEEDCQRDSDDDQACMNQHICEAAGLDLSSCNDEDTAEINEQIGFFCAAMGEGGDGALLPHPFCHALAGYWPA